jgi:hypothetical protein
MGFKKITQKILKLFGREIKQSYTITLDKRQMKNFSCLSHQFEKISSIPGNIIECGIGRGRTITYLTYLTEQDKYERNVWGFDSFEGFPEPSKEDGGPRNPKKGEWNYMKPKDIESILENVGINKKFLKNRVKIIPGFFKDSLREYDNSPIALLFIDVDLYKSYLDVLDKFYVLMSKGGIIIFDEYHDPNWPGAKKAIDEFFIDKLEKPTACDVGGCDTMDRYFVIKQ